MEKLEKGCIMPHNLVKKLKEDDTLVLSSLCRFCNCTSEDLFAVLKERNKIPDEGTNSTIYYGYKTRNIREEKKVRTLHIPIPTLAKIQSTIKERLSFVPTCLTSMAGKPGDDAFKNAEIHRKNQYLITLDIKNAYPSVDTNRIYKHLRGSLAKPLEYWAPNVENKEEKDLFIRTLTHLCVCENELPQGASTSSQIQNIVMADFDKKIEKKLPELVGSHMVYSRYADDITVSFPHFRTLDVLQEKMKIYSNEIAESAAIEAIMENFRNDVFIITDNRELDYLQKEIKKIKELIEEKSSLSSEQKYSYIGQVNAFKQQIKYSGRRITDIQNELYSIIGNEGRKLNTKKTKTRTPQSNTEREINGLSFDEKGNRGITKKKRAIYTRIFNDVVQYSQEELHNFSYYGKFNTNYPFHICATKITSIINGIYHRLIKVYGRGNVPLHFSDAYENAKHKRASYENYQSWLEKKSKQTPDSNNIKDTENNNGNNNGNNDDVRKSNELVF